MLVRLSCPPCIPYAHRRANGAVMANTIRSFDFKIDIHGAFVVPARSLLCPGCLTDSEIDLQIELLKDDLDAVARRMKKAIRKQAKRPLILEMINAERS